MKRNKCRYFNGTLNNTCRKGISYTSVEDSNHNNDLPCVSWHKASTTCPDKSFFTDAEMEESRRNLNKQFENFKLAREAITQNTEGKRGISGEIDCPVCKTGKLKYVVAALNGHIHAICTTDDCMSWME